MARTLERTTCDGCGREVAVTGQGLVRHQCAHGHPCSRLEVVPGTEAHAERCQECAAEALERVPLGRLLWIARRLRGDSQTKAAEAIGVTWNTVSRWERLERSPKGLSVAAIHRYLRDT